MSETFLHRLFARRFEGRWPEAMCEPWDEVGSASDEVRADTDEAAKESLDQLVARARTARGAELRRLTASRAERVLVALLSNPELGPEGARAIARRTQSANVLAELARNRTHSADPEVAQAICLNTKTPYFAARSLLGRLPVHALREIAQSSTSPPALAKEALSAISERRTRRQRGG